MHACTRRQAQTCPARRLFSCCKPLLTHQPVSPVGPAANHGSCGPQHQHPRPAAAVLWRWWFNGRSLAGSRGLAGGRRVMWIHERPGAETPGGRPACALLRRHVEDGAACGAELGADGVGPTVAAATQTSRGGEHVLRNGSISCSRLPAACLGAAARKPSGLQGTLCGRSARAVPRCNPSSLWHMRVHAPLRSQICAEPRPLTWRQRAIAVPCSDCYRRIQECAILSCWKVC